MHITLRRFLLVAITVFAFAGLHGSCRADNPIIADVHTADPATFVYDGTVPFHDVIGKPLVTPVVRRIIKSCNLASSVPYSVCSC